MSTEAQDRRLHRYFDGDVSAEERAEIEKELGASEIARRKLLALGDVRTLVTGAARDELSDAESASMWAAIERGAGLTSAGLTNGLTNAGLTSAGATTTTAKPIAEGAPPTRPALRVVQGDAKPKQIAPAEDELTRRRRRIGVGIGVLALAAAALLAFLRPGDPEQIATTVPDEVREPDLEGPPDSMRTEVLAVDFGTNVGTIFAVEGTEGQRYAVVWLDDAVKIDEGAASPDETAPN